MPDRFFVISKPKDTMAVTDLFNEECIDSHSKIVDLALVEFLTRRIRFHHCPGHFRRLKDFRLQLPDAEISGRKKKQNFSNVLVLQP